MATNNPFLLDVRPPENGSLAASYILSLFRPDDLVCVMLLRGEESPHWFARAKEVASPEYLARLAKKNEDGLSIYVCMNPLTAKRRVKANVANIRTLYLDLDHNGSKSLEKIRRSALVPKPNFIVESSPNRFYVVWLVDGIALTEQETLLRALIVEFGGDSAACDMTRVLRLPGFINHKYPNKPVVRIVENNFNGGSYAREAFGVAIKAPQEKSQFKCVDEIYESEGRNDYILRFASSLRAKGAADEAVRAASAAENQAKCHPPMDDTELDRIVTSALRSEYKQNDVKRRAKQKESIGPAVVVSNEPEVTIVTNECSDMPRDVLVGRLGEMCERSLLNDFPIAYAWPAILTAASVLVPEQENGNLHNLYTALIGGVNKGKSQCIDWSVKLLRIAEDPSRYSEVKPGSAERLLKYMNRLHDQGKLAPRVLMALDEWKFFFDKAGIENSVFPTLLTTGFYKRNTDILDNYGRPVCVPASFSWIGGVVTEVYDECFSRVTALGLHDRFLQGVCPSDYKGFNYRPFGGEMLSKDFKPAQIAVDKAVWWRLKEWRQDNPQATREGEIALRAAVICASFDGATLLTDRDLEPHFLLAAEQMKSRETFKPNPGETTDAQCANKVENYMRAHGPAGEWLDFRAMMKEIHYERFGPNAFTRTIQGLAGLKIVEIGERRPHDGKDAGGRPAKVIRLVLE
jgi:hypothetical protein